MSTSKDKNPDKDFSVKHNLSKFEYDLFKDESHVVHKVYQVKFVKLPNDGKNWKIICDDKILFIIEGIKLSKKEKEFLSSVDGFKFLLNFSKINDFTLKRLKAELKLVIF